MPALLLASSSPYRQQLLQRLQLSFSCQAPNIDETVLEGESGRNLTIRLAKEKALALAQTHPNHLIIGSDQVAVLANGEILGKPHTLERAQAQLRAASGSSVSFLTAIALLNSQTGHCQIDCVPYTVHFRTLSERQILNYLEREQPFDCAGSFKSEGLGISLFASTEGSDATSLVGLPLIKLIDMLKNEGVEVL